MGGRRFFIIPGGILLMEEIAQRVAVCPLAKACTLEQNTGGPFGGHPPLARKHFPCGEIGRGSSTTIRKRKNPPSAAKKEGGIPWIS